MAAVEPQVTTDEEPDMSDQREEAGESQDALRHEEDRKHHPYEAEHDHGPEVTARTSASTPTTITTTRAEPAEAPADLP